MVQAMGGEDAWNAVHFVRFDFKWTAGDKVMVNNAHLWDRKDGRYRIERVLKGSEHEVDLFSIADYQRAKSGSAYLDGKKLEGDQAQKLLEGAYTSYINDALEVDGDRSQSEIRRHYGARAANVRRAHVGHVGLTPGDMYHAFVSQKSHLMTHWEYTLQSGVKDSWEWQYGDFHGVKLATNHIDPKKVTINMGDVNVLDQVDDSFFNDPAHALSELK